MNGKGLNNSVDSTLSNSSEISLDDEEKIKLNRFDKLPLNSFLSNRATTNKYQNGQNNQTLDKSLINNNWINVSLLKGFKANTLDGDFSTHRESIKKSLDVNLNSNLKILKRSELGFWDKEKPIVNSEQFLIEECLILLSGLKSNFLFTFDEGNFHLNKNIRLINLYKELEDCLRPVAYYGSVMVRLENFVVKYSKSFHLSTLTYEAFIECLVEYLKYLKISLNRMAVTLEKKERKFTLVDFLRHIRDEYFAYLDFLKLFLDQIDRDTDKTACEKSINLLVIIHKHLVMENDCFFMENNNSKMKSKFLVWIFVRTLKPYLKTIDTFIEEGTLLDSRYELGFKRNPHIPVNSYEYLKSGYEILLKLDQDSEALPLFMRIILLCSFKICKYIEIASLLNSTTQKSDIFESFLVKIKEICPYLQSSNGDCEPEPTRLDDRSTPESLLRINFNNLKISVGNSKLKSTERLASIERLFESTANECESDDTSAYFSLEEKLESILNECYLKYVKYSSTQLMDFLVNKFQMYKFFEYLQSYYLFKSNEIMFIFSKRLFDLIKVYETYQDDAVLNKLFYKSVSSMFTSDLFSTGSKGGCKFSSNMVTLHYDADMAARISSQAMVDAAASSSTSTFNTDSSRLVNAIHLRIKICWPLDIIVSKANLDTYNRLFLFIMQIKQVKYDLDSLNLNEMDLRKVKKKENLKGKISESCVKKMLLLRFKLMNYMNNAHDLICNQIYEISDEFLKSLRDSKLDIDEIIELHEKFLNKLVKYCLLNNKQFRSSFTSIFNLILDYCDLWRKGIDYFTQENHAYLDDLEKNINLYIGFAYKILKTLVNKSHSTSFQLLVSSLEYIIS